MKTLSLIALVIACCSCMPEHPALRIIYRDPKNNRADEKGNLVPWTNWGIGYWSGSNWVEVLRAKESD